MVSYHLKLVLKNAYIEKLLYLFLTTTYGEMQFFLKKGENVHYKTLNSLFVKQEI